MQQFRNLKEVEEALQPFQPSKITRFAYTTEHIQRFLEYVGNPQDVPKAIHIAGTSGKTSTAYYAAALLKQAGKRVGLMVSPHAEHLNERVQIDLVPLPEKDFCAEMAIFLETVRKSGIVLTHAELLYAFAYWEFARQNVEYIVIEVGMGGLLDATNVMTRPDKICVITDIGLDHTNVLGGTIKEIAGHKAGIIGLHNVVFFHQQPKEIVDVIRSESKQRQADMHIITRAEKTPPEVRFLPLFQQRNFSLAFKAVDFALERDGARRLTSGMMRAAAETYIPSRMERHVIGEKTLILDGAHNAQKLQALAVSLRALFPDSPLSILVGFTGGRGRNTSELATALATLKPERVIVTSLQAQEGLPPRVEPAEVVKAFSAAGMQTDLIADQRQACDALVASESHVLLVTGSLYLTGQLKPLLLQSVQQFVNQKPALA
jgi:dihydrofolate synthase/folylpolyglutamate synthase